MYKCGIVLVEEFIDGCGVGVGVVVVFGGCVDLVCEGFFDESVIGWFVWSDEM